MTGPNWDDDEGLFADLRAAVRGRAEVPDAFVQAGKDMFDWRAVDAQLADLTYDSAATGHDRELATVRGENPPRAMSFRAGSVMIELEISADGVRGQVIPASSATVRIDDGTDLPVSVQSDAEGWFAMSPAPLRAFRLSVRVEGGAVARTGWIDPPDSEPS